MTKIIETHCHLDYLKQAPLEELIRLALEHNIEKIITIAVAPENFDAVRDIADKYDIVYFTQGTHPHDATKATDESYLLIKERSQHPKMVAVGEIGLDYHYEHSPMAVQEKVFRKHLEIAVELDKPVVIHSRDAEDDTMRILKDYNVRGVIHSFTSKPELAEFALDKGLYIGFNGIITFKNAHDVRAVLVSTPLDRVLLETDSPFLTPIPHRGKENAPHYLNHIAEKVAEVKGLSLDDVICASNRNAKKLFFK